VAPTLGAVPVSVSSREHCPLNRASLDGASHNSIFIYCKVIYTCSMKRGKKRRKLFAFVIEEHLKAGLKLVKTRDGVSESEQARRAIEQWLKERNALPKTQKRR
jgi:hypothetical protein